MDNYKIEIFIIMIIEIICFIINMDRLIKIFYVVNTRNCTVVNLC